MSEDPDRKQQKSQTILKAPITWPLIRDVALFVGGLAGVAHETILAAAERPTLLILFAAMMGLPAFLRTDDKKNDNKGS